MYFFFNDTATTEIYTLSLHDALPISAGPARARAARPRRARLPPARLVPAPGPRPGLLQRPRAQHGELVGDAARSEEHTSELQSRQYLVCRLLLEKKKI